MELKTAHNGSLFPTLYIIEGKSCYENVFTVFHSQFMLNNNFYSI